MVLALAPWAPRALAEERNLFDWVALAPLVVEARNQGEDGRFVKVGVRRVLRGDAAPDDELLVDVRTANQERDRWIDKAPLRLDPDSRYVLLLEPAFVRQKDGATIYRVVRGTRGARELPAEGAEAVLAALGRFIEIQDQGSDARLWRLLAAMLEETDPLFLETALDEFLRYRRGSPDLLPAVRPLFDHPGPAIREKAVRLAGQILQRQDAVDLPAGQELRAELIARARRDEVVPVRVAATETLRWLPGPEIQSVLEEISSDDPDQDVRYAAELILLDRRGAQGSRSGPRGRSD